MQDRDEENECNDRRNDAAWIASVQRSHRIRRRKSNVPFSERSDMVEQWAKKECV
jgi:hypothetical protein